MVVIDYIFKRIKIKHHCVIVVGEGAGFAVRDFNIELSGKTDKSGNPVLPDIGLILKEEIKKRAEERGIDINLKYINPTYIIRACPPNSYDVKYCVKLAQGAINGAFAGFTNFSIGIVNHHPCFIPINKISQDGVIRKIQTSDEDYIMMLATTGQPSFYPQVTLTKDIKCLKGIGMWVEAKCELKINGGFIQPNMPDNVSVDVILRAYVEQI